MGEGGKGKSSPENRVEAHKAEDDRPLLCSYFCRTNWIIDQQCPDLVPCIALVARLNLNSIIINPYPNLEFEALSSIKLQQLVEDAKLHGRDLRNRVIISSIIDRGWSGRRSSSLSTLDSVDDQIIASGSVGYVLEWDRREHGIIIKLCGGGHEICQYSQSLSAV